MKFNSMILAVALAIICVAIKPSYQKTECETKRESALRMVGDQAKNLNLNMAIVVPNCDKDGNYATLQCHHGSDFCQCWDKEGLPLTSPKKNLKKCACMIDRAKALKSIPPSQTEMPELTSCEVDGSYQAKQCNRTACWCVNKDDGKKISGESKDKSSVRC